jgi:hypothetical protein
MRRPVVTGWGACHLALGGLVLFVVLVGTMSTLPSHSENLLHQQGLNAERIGDLRVAVADYQAVLAQDAGAADTRGLLACSLWREGLKSIAAEQALRAVMNGWVPRLQGECGGGTNLADFFRVVPIGATGVLVVYTGSGSGGLVSRAENSALSEADRLVAASCLGLNAGFTAFGVEPLNTLDQLNIRAAETTTQLRGCLTDFNKWFACNSVGADCFLRWHWEMVRETELRDAGIGLK